MHTLLRGGSVFLEGSFQRADILLNDDRIAAIGDFPDQFGFDKIYHIDGLSVLPGFIDAHVHLREPGFSYKETIHSGTMAAAHGGFTSVFTMPNVNPPPDTLSHLSIQTEIIKQCAIINVYPYGTITRKHKEVCCLSDMDAIAPFVIGFSDDGKGVQDESIMRCAMRKAKILNHIIAAHCEDERFSAAGGVVHEGEWAKSHGYIGISAKSEYSQLERDIQLVKETGCSYHMCHVSTRESVMLLRQAKNEGLDITAETAPHYLLLDETLICDDGKYKVNPPIRSRSDREALVQGVIDGVIDMIATDHAPHHLSEKTRGLCDSLFGIAGLETCFQLMLTRLVNKNLISMAKLIDLMVYQPANRFKIKAGLSLGLPANLTVWDIHGTTRIDPQKSLSLCKTSPFSGESVQGICHLTLCGGRVVYELFG